MASISIITPVWNGLPYIRDCVESVRAQYFKDWEMILSDDGSTDGTRDYLKTLKDPRIRIFEQPSNRGIFGNLNFLFKQARAPITQILCQDDYLVGHSVLRRLLTFWSGQPPDLGFMRCNWGYDLGKCRLRRYAMKAVPPNVHPRHANLHFFVFGNIPGNLSNVSLRTQLVEEYGWFREDLPYAGDFEFWSRASQHCKFAVLTENLVFVRRHPGVASINLNRKGELIAQAHEVVSHLFKQLQSHYPTLLLKLHATANYDALQRNGAIAIRRKTGSWQYLVELDRVASVSEMFPGPVCRWIVFILTAGGRFGRVAIARRLFMFSNSTKLNSVSASL